MASSNLDQKFAVAFADIVPQIEAIAASPEANIHFHIAHGDTQLMNAANRDQRIYMASSIKPAYLWAYIQKLIADENLDLNTPQNYIDQNLANFMLADLEGEECDVMTADAVLQTLDLDVQTVRTRMKLDPSSAEYLAPEKIAEKLTQAKYSLNQIIEFTLGPSSNMSLIAVRNTLSRLLHPDAGNAYVEDTNLTETADYVRNAITSLIGENQIAITRSSLAGALGGNTADFVQLSNLNTAIFNLICTNVPYAESYRQALSQTATDPADVNRQHEIKHILLALGLRYPVIEKSGYWVDADKNGTGAVRLNSFARIFIDKQGFMDVHYAVEMPFTVEPDADEAKTKDKIAAKAKELNSQIATVIAAKLKQAFDQAA